MRLDKFLKVSRIIKRRTVAKELCQHGRVSLNGRPAKAGAELVAGDIVRIELAKRILEVEVVDTPKTVRAELANTLYVIKDTEEKENKPWL